MELIQEPTNPTTQNKLTFTGEGDSLLGIMLLNWVLSFFTFGLYYPWARVNKLKYLYGNTLLNDTPFIFHGTGKELFKGFIKFFALIVLVYAFYFYAVFSNDLTLVIVAIIVLLGFVCVTIPLALHGAFRYRLSRTSWRGIHLGYRGERGQLAYEFFIGFFLTIITFGIYSPWFMTKMRAYIIGHCRFGNLKFGYDGNGTDLFIIHLKAYFLMLPTLGLYYFWYRKEYINYFINYTYIEQTGKKVHLKGNITGSGFLLLSLTNFLLTIFTLGIAIPWVITRTMRFVISNSEIPQHIDFDSIAQTEDEYTDAIGEDVLDYFDLGII